MNAPVFSSTLRKSAKWLVLIAIAVAVFYRVKFAAVPVEAFEVQPNIVLGEVMGTGTLDARVKTTISPRIQERLAEVLVDQNDFVKVGQSLARLDDGELKRQMAIAEAALAAAKSTAERVRVDEIRAQAVEQQARQEHRRVSDLHGTKISSASEMDKAVEQMRIAEADSQRAHAASSEAEKQIITAERNLDYHRERLAFAEMRSPYDGMVTRRDRHPGGVVVPGNSILQLIATNELWVSAWVDETAAAALTPGQPARVVFRSQPDRSHPGEVARLGRETDRETREFLVEVRVRELPPNWTIGQRAEVFIETGRNARALAVPQRFVQWQHGKPGVWVAHHGKATWREVTLGLRGRETVDVARGLAAGQKVVAPSKPTQPPLKAAQRIAIR